MSVWGTIGIIVLCVVAAAAILLLLAAYFPIACRLDAKGKNEEIRADGKAKWLFGVLSADLKYDQKTLTYGLKIIGIPFRKGKVDDLPKLLKEAGAEQWETVIREAPPEKSAAEDTAKSAAENVEGAAEPAESTAETSKSAAEDAAGKEEPLEEGLREFAATVKRVYKKYDKIRTILVTRSGRRTTSFLKKQILELLNRTKPFIIRGRICYGFEDVALTAILYGLFGNLAFQLAGEELSLLPDFAEQGLDLDVETRGRMQAWPVLSLIFRTMSDEGVQKLRGAVKRIINEA